MNWFDRIETHIEKVYGECDYLEGYDLNEHISVFFDLDDSCGLLGLEIYPNNGISPLSQNALAYIDTEGNMSGASPDTLLELLRI